MCLNCLGGDTDKCLINVYYYSGVFDEEMRLRQAVQVDAVVKGREITASPRVSKDVMEAGHGNTNS